jgi:hypothetical protein
MTAQKQENEINGEKGLGNPIFEVSQILEKAREIDNRLVDASFELEHGLIVLNNKTTQLFDLAYRLMLEGEIGITIDEILDIVDELNALKRRLLVESYKIVQTRKLNALPKNDS